MAIKVVQTCDSCGDSRLLSSTLSHENGGWRQLRDDLHICPLCIDRILDPVEGARTK